MNPDNSQPVNVRISVVTGLGALIAATLASMTLSGTSQALVLAMCFVVMGVSVLNNMMIQRNLGTQDERFAEMQFQSAGNMAAAPRYEYQAPNVAVLSAADQSRAF